MNVLPSALSPSDLGQARCLSITLGYFIYDTIGVYLIEHDWGNTIHHSASMAAIAVGIFQKISGSELTWSLFLMELSNPLLHLQSYFQVGQDFFDAYGNIY